MGQILVEALSPNHFSAAQYLIYIGLAHKVRESTVGEQASSSAGEDAVATWLPRQPSSVGGFRELPAEEPRLRVGGHPDVGARHWRPGAQVAVSQPLRSAGLGPASIPDSGSAAGSAYQYINTTFS